MEYPIFENETNKSIVELKNRNIMDHDVTNDHYKRYVRSTIDNKKVGNYNTFKIYLSVKRSYNDPEIVQFSVPKDCEILSEDTTPFFHSRNNRSYQTIHRHIFNGGCFTRFGNITDKLKDISKQYNDRINIIENIIKDNNITMKPVYEIKWNRHLHKLLRIAPYIELTFN